MNISANTLFHFTKELQTIESILVDKFYGSYCKEILHFRNEKAPLIIPMISFCDIPLKTISDVTKYGKYGIGMTKEWGIKNKLNPVFYLEKESLLAESLVKSLFSSYSIIEFTEPEVARIKARIDVVNNHKSYNAISKRSELAKLQADLRKLSNMASGMQHMMYSIYFTKHYADDLIREGKEPELNYRFYDEREWRFIPEFDCAVCELRKTELDYLLWRGNSPKKPKLPEVSLAFSASDIEYVIVETKREKKNIREFIKSIDNARFSQEEKEDLYSKIISFEEVEKDM